MVEKLNTMHFFILEIPSCKDSGQYFCMEKRKEEVERITNKTPFVIRELEKKNALTIQEVMALTKKSRTTAWRFSLGIEKRENGCFWGIGKMMRERGGWGV